jgi:hypothetical protein
MNRAAIFALAAALAAGAPAHALENEKLLVSLPRGYKVGSQKTTPKGSISEMVPAAETVENWTEMVTVQIFLGMRDVTPTQYRERMQKLWSNTCADSEFAKLKDGVENGYAALTWMQKCPLNPHSGKPELTWLKAVQGQDSFYLVQKAFKFEPSAEQRKEWGKFLDGVRVCDSRLQERPCKSGG